MTVSDDYLAGLFDGEGSISIAHRPRYERRGGGCTFLTTVRVMLASKNRLLVDFYVERFGGGLSFNARSGVYNWYITGLTAHETLTMIAARCQQKRQLALIALQMLELIAEVGRVRGLRPPGSKLASEDNLAARIDLAAAAKVAQKSQYEMVS